MSDHRDVATESRTLTLQAVVFRALRDMGLEPELSDISAARADPADTLEAQMFRTLVGSDIVAHLRATIGTLEEAERHWVYRVADAACRRHERKQHPQVTSRRSITIAAQPVALVTATTATATTVVFRRRNGGGHE